MTRLACFPVFVLLCAAKANDMDEVLTGLIVHDRATGDEPVFELLRRDAPRATAMADSFCTRHMRRPDSRASCKETIKAHLLAAGHLSHTEPLTEPDAEVEWQKLEAEDGSEVLTDPSNGEEVIGDGSEVLTGLAITNPSNYEEVICDGSEVLRYADMQTWYGIIRCGMA